MVVIKKTSGKRSKAQPSTMDDLDIINTSVKKSNNNLAAFVKALKASNIPVKRVIRGDMDQDPAIFLDKRCHITLGLDGKFGLAQQLPDGRIRFMPTRKTLSEVIADYRNV